MRLVRALAILFAVIVIALHILRLDVSPIERGISRYASGATLTLMTIAFLALAGAVGIAAAMTRSWLLAIAAVALAGVAALPDPNLPPVRSLPHTVCGFVFFVSATAGLCTIHRSSPLLAWVPVVALLLFFASVAGVPGLARVPGLLQRVCFATIVASLVTIRAVR
jgi:4-hydroxybenzoate polyprenyltransferase